MSLALFSYQVRPLILARNRCDSQLVKVLIRMIIIISTAPVAIALSKALVSMAR